MLTLRFISLSAWVVFAILSTGCPASAETEDRAPSPSSITSEIKPLKLPVACQRDTLPQRGLRTGTMEIETQPTPTTLNIEFCLSEKQRRVGMMCRTQMAANEGMLFVFPQSRPRSFWMKNTLIPLDMLFLDADGRIVGIIEKAEPLTLSSRKVKEPAQYVLEIAGGQAKALGIEVGQYAGVFGLPKDSRTSGVRRDKPEKPPGPVGPQKPARR